MVFRKPYGFLIKHFKLIHLILTGLFIYLLSNVNGILTYYNKFIAGTVGKLDAYKYMNNYHMIVVIASIVICLIVYALLRYKKKPRLLYIGLIGFVLLVAVMINLVQDGLETIYFGVLDTKTLRLYRDLLRILVVFQYISVAIVLVRGLGFDIKKFNFVADLQELNLDVSDEEEIELELGGTETLQRKINRKIREFKYYYLENKIFINIIVIVVLVLGASTLFVKNEIIDKVYEEGEQFSAGSFNFKVLDSYVTKLSYDNEVVASSGYSYVVVKTVVASSSDQVVSTGNLLLNVNNNSYSHNSYSGNRFADLGIPYRKQQIDGTFTYLFVYKVSDDDIGSKMKLVYAGDKTVNLSPIMLDEAENETNYKLGEKLDLSSSTFGSGYMLIDSFEISEKFSYPFQYEMNGKTYDSQYLISSAQGVILKIVISAEYPLNLDNFTFLSTYGSLKYKVGDTEYTSKIFNNKTPGNEKNSMYLAVDKDMANAEEIWFDIQVRNYKYVYKIR